MADGDAIEFQQPPFVSILLTEYADGTEEVTIATPVIPHTIARK